jgi:hypothetical protein
VLATVFAGANRGAPQAPAVCRIDDYDHITAADRLCDEVRQRDAFARLGGSDEQFVSMLTSCESAANDCSSSLGPLLACMREPPPQAVLPPPGPSTKRPHGGAQPLLIGDRS